MDILKSKLLLIDENKNLVYQLNSAKSTIDGLVQELYRKSKQIKELETELYERLLLVDENIAERMRIEFNEKMNISLSQEQYDKLCEIECTDNFAWATNILEVLKILKLI